jgi:hypothetical protein
MLWLVLILVFLAFVTGYLLCHYLEAEDGNEFLHNNQRNW